MVFHFSLDNRSGTCYKGDMNNKREHKWLSELPKDCQICNKPFGKYFIDGRTIYISWALMCEKCHDRFGFGLGIGNGQKYETKTKKGVEGFNE